MLLLQVIQMQCNLESNEEGTKTHVSHTVLQVLCPFCASQLSSLMMKHTGLYFFLSNGLIWASRFNIDYFFPQLSLFLKMDDKLHRQLSCDIFPSTFKSVFRLDTILDSETVRLIGFKVWEIIEDLFTELYTVFILVLLKYYLWNFQRTLQKTSPVNSSTMPS